MSLASRIADLTTAIATAMNARNRIGASAYDIAVINGYTGTQAQWLSEFQDAGTTDYAAVLNANITANNASAGIATEGTAGVTQLATLAETVSSSNTAKAVSPYNLALSRIALNLTELNSKAAGMPRGTIITLTQQDWSGAGNGYLYNSVWMVDDAQRATPIRNLVATDSTTLTYLASVCGTGKTYASIFLDPYNTKAIVGAAPTRNEYLYVGATTGFYQWTGVYTGWGYQNGIVDRGSGHVTRITMMGEYVHAHIMGHTNATAIAQYGALIGAPQDMIKPVNGDEFFTGAKVVNGNWTTTTFYASMGDTSFRPLTAGVEANSDFVFSGVYKRAIPTA